MALKVSMKGTTSLIVAAVVVAVVLLLLPAYRLFFGISVLIGIAVAGILYLRNKYFPVKEEDLDNKRPLGL
ncbi:MAG TPA: hypothetical protein VFA74_05285 [Terriglobales bacterium]|nr:hypothetical protein [Terriglobales bacterium]